MTEKPSLPKTSSEEPTQPPAAEDISVESNLAPGESAGQPAEVPSPLPETPVTTHVENSLAVSVNAQQNAVVDNSLVLAVAAGKDMMAIESANLVAAVGRNLDIQQGGAAVLVVGAKAQVKNSQIGLLIAKDEVTLENSRVLMTTQQALALGAALGAVCALVSRLLGRKK